MAFYKQTTSMDVCLYMVNNLTTNVKEIKKQRVTRKDKTTRAIS